MALTDAEKLAVRHRHSLNNDSAADNYITDFKVYRYKDGAEYNKANMNIDYLVENFDGSTMGVFSLRSPLEIVTFGVSSLKDENNVWVEWTGGEG
tara:strand:+ start:12320 stop:12604 length:285 start_codon:yes stop_codon:yes gene_type:complete